MCHFFFQICNYICKFVTELRPWNDVRIHFHSIYFRMNGQNLTEFVYTITLTGSTLRLFCNSDLSILFPLSILRMTGQNLTKFCLHSNIDMIWDGIVTCHFSQICK